MTVTYAHTKASVNLVKLNLEINAEEFSQALVKSKDTLAGSDNLLTTFVAALTSPEQTTLATLVTNHDGNPPTEYGCFCYDCGSHERTFALSALTACPCCSGTDIQTAYHNDNLDATTNPGVSNDGTEGYCEGSRWLNVSTGKSFICLDNTTDAAVWKIKTIG